MSNKLTVDEIESGTISDNRFNRFDDELINKYFNDEGKRAIELYAKAQLSQLVNEIIGDYNYTQPANDQHRIENNLIGKQRQRAIKHGFALENIDE